MMSSDTTGDAQRRENADEEYGACFVCGNWQRLTARGNLYQHRKRDRFGHASGEQCDGAGEPPKGDGHG